MFVFILALFVLGLREAANRFGFVPLEWPAGGWLQNPVAAVLSPLASQFLPIDFFSLIFNGIFLLIAGRYRRKGARSGRAGRGFRRAAPMAARWRGCC